MLTFTPITLEHHALLRKYYAGCDYHLCEYSAGTKLMWSLYLRPSFAEEAGCLIVRNRIDGEWVFDYPVPGPDGDVDAALTAIESYCTDTETPLVISVVPGGEGPGAAAALAPSADEQRAQLEGLSLSGGGHGRLCGPEIQRPAQPHQQIPQGVSHGEICSPDRGGHAPHREFLGGL